MKQLLYHIVFCCLAAVFFTACDKDDTLPVTGAGGDGNSIILDLASASLPVSRATVQATGVEVAVSHLDVLIFDGNGNKEWHERVSGSAGGSGKITLSAKRSDFAANEKYWVYLIANSTAEADVFDAEDFNLNKLRGITQEDERIHVTGLDVTDAPKTFLMDGIAYPKGQEEPKPGAAVELNNGEKADDTELQVTLRRAAAKIVVKIEKGEHVRFDNNGPDPTITIRPGYYLRNMPYSTSVLPSSMDAETAKLRTPDLFNGNYFDWTPDLITVTAYAYAHTWKNASTLEKEVRLIVNIPMYNTPRDETGKPTGDEEVYLSSSYYQIPVSASKELNRNTCYEVTVTVDAPGGSDPSKPVELTDINYSVYDWQEEKVNVGGEDERPAYLTLNEYEMEMHNMEDDNTTLEFASSSAVTATINRVYYIDKFGQEKDLKIINESQDPDEWGENRGNNYRPDWRNRCTIRITPDANITGKIDVFGTVPENNAVRYIEFTVSNDDNISRKVKVAQYPLTYITNVEGYYSYRDDFVSTASDGTRGVTTWELLAGKEINKGQQYSSEQVPYDERTAWICGCSWNNNRWSYSKNGTGFFGSKVVVSVNSTTGLSDIEYARWTEEQVRHNEGTSWRPQWVTSYKYNTTTSSVDLNNHRMYHVTITATSSEYTLGRPRITDGKTDPGEDNAVLVSPSFMLASQLGAVMDANNVNIAASHCEQYVEVAQDGKVYDDWRLPTRAEIEIIYKYQNDSDAMDEVLSGESYWSASPNAPIRNPKPSSTGTYRIRCIRDAYDKETGK